MIFQLRLRRKIMLVFTFVNKCLKKNENVLPRNVFNVSSEYHVEVFYEIFQVFSDVG